MGGELVTTEKTWLEVVKAAANLQQRDLFSQDDGRYPPIIDPGWIGFLTDKTNVEIGNLELLNSLPLSNEDRVQITQSFPGLQKKDEQTLVKEMKHVLEVSDGLSKQNFLGLLEPYLRSLKDRQEEIITAEGKTSGGRNNGVTEGNDEESTLRLLKHTAKLLGHRLVALILECSISLNFWVPVQILLERRVVVSSSSSKLVPSLVEYEEPLILCLYIANVPDLTPQDVFSLLTFFLDSCANPSKSFQLVGKEWRRVAVAEIERAGRNRNSIRAADNRAIVRNLEKTVKDHDSLISSAIGLAMAVDGFSSPELCMHHLLASGIDEAVLSSVLSQLSTLQVLTLTQYLVRWISRYSSYLENFPTPDCGRVPSFGQVLSWAGVVLEGHFTQLVLSADFHSELRSMRSLVQSLVDFCTKISPLGGITEHVKSRSLLPVQQQQGGSASDYVIELLDLS